MINNNIPKVIVTSRDFEDGGKMPTENTGFGEDASPELKLHNLDKKAVSIVVLMNDLDIPFFKEYTHWTIWNIPA